MDKKIICNIHTQIGNLIQKLYGLDYTIDTKQLRSNIENVVNEMNKLLLSATEAGQHMENRLKEYREAIEKLGFKRNKNGLIDWQIKHLKEKVGLLGIKIEKNKKSNLYK